MFAMAKKDKRWKVIGRGFGHNIREIPQTSTRTVARITVKSETTGQRIGQNCFEDSINNIY